MAILFLFAFLAGFATVLSPCSLPVLPALLSGGINKGVYRPLGIILGLIASFTFFTLALTAIVQATGISASFLRFFAICIIAFFGVVMLFPQLGDRFSSLTSGLANVGNKFQGYSSGSGFLGGIVLGLALGLVWTPCAGPILASIAALAATNGVTLNAVFITLTYGLGSGIPLFLIAYGGQRLILSSKILHKHVETIRKGFGVLMILTALAMYTNLDVALQQYVVEYFPDTIVDDRNIVKNELQKLRPIKDNEFSKRKEIIGESDSKSILPNLGKAPEISGITNWINSSPLTIARLQGKVVLIDFWTYSCINCIRTLPYVTKWFDTYKDKGLVVIGVHTPEFEFEKNPANVAKAAKRFHINYPIAQDNNYVTWSAFQNSYWPAHYLIDQDGNLRQEHFGEGGYVETENAIRSLLNLSPLKESKTKISTHRPLTAESYLGYSRAERYASEIYILQDQSKMYSFSAVLEQDAIGITGKWLISAEGITAESNNCYLYLNFLATEVYLVLSGSSPYPITVDLDDKTLPKEFWTKDMDKGQIFVKEARKYDIVDLKGHYGRHLIKLHIPKGIIAHAFTFGDEQPEIKDKESTNMSLKYHNGK
jgi:cytochrome c biogenesis protein CcdA/thiol-disulfide isomerase/thioredoxin